MLLESLRIQPLSHARLVDLVSASRLECLDPLDSIATLRFHHFSAPRAHGPRGILGLVPLLEAFLKGIRKEVWVTEKLLTRR